MTALIESDEIADEEKERKKNKKELVDDVADKPRDDASLLSVRGEMRLAARFRTARRACFGVALVFGGMIMWARAS